MFNRKEIASIYIHMQIILLKVGVNFPGIFNVFEPTWL